MSMANPMNFISRQKYASLKHKPHGFWSGTYGIGVSCSSSLKNGLSYVHITVRLNLDMAINDSVGNYAWGITFNTLISATNLQKNFIPLSFLNRIG